MPTINKCKGLITSTSELVRPEGSLIKADNVVIYRDNTINPARGIVDYGDTLPLSTDRIKQIIKYKDRLIRHYSTVLQYDNGSGTFGNFNGSYTELETGLRLKYIESQSNLYFTTNTGVKKISATAASDFTTSADFIKNSGLPKGLDVSSTLVYDAAGFLPPGSKAAYRVVWGNTDLNGNVILSSPSERHVVTNSSRTQTLSEITTITTTAGTSLTGTYFIFYDGNEQGYFPWFSEIGASPATEQPTTAEVVGLTPLEIEFNTTDTDDEIAARTGNILSTLTTINVSVSTNTITIENNSGAETTDATDGSVATSFTFTITQNGQTTTGQYCNVTINSTIPTEILSDTYNTYYYQLYRSAVVTALDSQTLDEIEPDDELNLIYENNISSAEHTAKKITILDEIPESFREAGAYLYTNPNSAEGILQANDRPPIAKDIALFKNSVFFANTKTPHRKQISMLSTSGFTSGTSKFLIGTIEYTFTGTTEVSKAVTVAKSSITPNSFFHLNSTNNENKYVVWMDTGTTCATHEGNLAVTSHDWSAANETVTMAYGYASHTNSASVTSHDWSGGGNETIVIGANTATLTANCADIDAIIAEIATAFAAATPAAITDVVASKITGDKIKLTSVASGPTVSFTLDATSTALTTLNLTAGTYTTIKTATLTTNCATAAAIVSEINTKFATATPEAITGFTAYKTENDGYIGIRSNSGGTTQTFGLAGTAMTTLGMTAATYSGLNTSTAPEINDHISFRINIESASTDANVAQCLSDALGLSTDFNCSISTNQVTISHIRNGLVDNIVDSTENPTGFTLSVTVAGTGEDAASKKVLLAKVTDEDGSLSASQAIDETARSLIRVVNKDATSPVYAYYLSSVSDLPGIIMFERKTNEDTIFKLGSTSDIGAKFSPELANPAVLESDNEVSPNRIYYSKLYQSEYVPILNYIDVGPKDDQIRRIIALRDSLFILKENGTYTLSGTYGNFTVRAMANSTNIIAPDSAVVLNNQIFMLTSQGVDVLSETGDVLISEPIKDEILPLLNSRYSFEFTTFGVSYESYKEYFLFLVSETSDTVATQCYRYNTANNTWTRYTVTATSGIVLSSDDKLYIGAGDKNVLGKERKNYDRTDYANREYTISIASGSVSGNEVSVSSIENTEIGDVVYQSQYLTISKFNRLCRKLDQDSGIDKHGVNYSTLELESGANLSNAITDLVAKLNVDDVAGYTFSGTTDFSTMKTEYNVIIGRLNSGTSHSVLKSYDELSDAIEFEAVITDIDRSANRLTLNYAMPFVVGNLTLYKAIVSEFIYSPVHFDVPEQLKQVREGTFIFNQNNFYSAVVSYASDRSQEYEEIEVYGKGLGTFGGFNFGDATFGGEGNDVPVRTLIPREKQRCRYITPRFEHKNAREDFAVVGVSLEGRPTGTKAYK